MVLAVALAAGCRDPAAGPGKLSGRERVPLYRVARAAGAITVDGRLDEVPWRDALQMPLVDSLTGRPPRHPTVARLLWDERHLYLAFECRGGEGSAQPDGRQDDPVHQDRAVKVLLAPGGRGQGYAEIEVKPEGVLLDARVASRGSDLSPGRSGAIAAARVERSAGAQGWTVELALPLETARGAAPLPRAGTRWRANLYRLEGRGRDGIADGHAFSPPRSRDLHALERFGWLVFD